MNYHDMSDRELVEYARNGDKFAWSEIYGRYKGMVLRAAFLDLPNRDDAEDVRQKAFLRIFEKLWEFDESKKGGLGAWLFRIASNLAKDFGRGNRRRNRGRFPSNILEVGGRIGSTLVSRESEQSDALVQREEAKRLLPGLLAALKPEQRVALQLRHIEELEYDHIAEIMGTTPSAAKQRVHRALENARGINSAKISGSEDGTLVATSETSNGKENVETQEYCQERPASAKGQKSRRVTRMKGRRGPKKSA